MDSGSNGDMGQRSASGRRLSMFSDGQRKSLFGSLANALIGFGKARTSFSVEPHKPKEPEKEEHEPSYQ